MFFASEAAARTLSASHECEIIPLASKGLDPTNSAVKNSVAPVAGKSSVVVPSLETDSLAAVPPQVAPGTSSAISLSRSTFASKG